MQRPILNDQQDYYAITLNFRLVKLMGSCCEFCAVYDTQKGRFTRDNGKKQELHADAIQNWNRETHPGWCIVDKPPLGCPIAQDAKKINRYALLSVKAF